MYSFHIIYLFCQSYAEYWNVKWNKYQFSPEGNSNAHKYYSRYDQMPKWPENISWKSNYTAVLFKPSDVCQVDQAWKDFPGGGTEWTKH